MPQAVAAVFVYVFTGTTLAAVLIRTLIVNTVLSKISQALAPKPKREQAAVRGNFHGSVNYQQIVFGRVRSGGQVATVGTSGARNEKLHLAICTSLTHAGGVEGVGGYWINENFIDLAGSPSPVDGNGDVISGKYDGMVNIQSYSGTQTTPDSALVAALSGKGLWDSDAVGRGCAYHHFTFLRDPDDQKFQEAFPGFPVGEVLQDGCLVYDVREDSTRGGSGSQRADDPTTWGPSVDAAPANVLATYLMMRRVDGGAGIDPSRIDWTTVAAAATVCDELIATPAGNIPRYRCDIGLNTGNAVEDNIEAILNTMQGGFIPSNNGFKIFAGKYDTPVATLDDDWILEYSYSGADIQRLWNVVKATFTDPDQEYTPASVLFEDAAYQTADQNQRLPDEYAFPGVNNYYRAQYIATTIGRRSRYQRTLTMSLNMRGRELEPWDIVTVQIPEIGLNAPFRIINWTPTEAGAAVELIEENAAIWNVPSFATAPTFTRPATQSEAPPQVTGASAVGVADAIVVRWDTLGPGVYSVFSVERSDDGSTGWAEVWNGRANEYSDPLTGGQTKHYRIRALAPQGFVWGAYSSVVTTTALLSGAVITSLIAGGDIVDDGVGGWEIVP